MYQIWRRSCTVNVVIFGKISRKCSQDISRGGIFVSPAKHSDTYGSLCPSSVCLSVCHTRRAMFCRRHMHSSECCHYFSRFYSYFLHKGIWVLFSRGDNFREEDKNAKITHTRNFPRLQYLYYIRRIRPLKWKRGLQSVYWGYEGQLDWLIADILWSAMRKTAKRYVLWGAVSVVLASLAHAPMRPLIERTASWMYPRFIITSQCIHNTKTYYVRRSTCFESWSILR